MRARDAWLLLVWCWSLAWPLVVFGEASTAKPTPPQHSERQSVYERLRLSLSELASLSDSLQIQLQTLSDDNATLQRQLTEQQSGYSLLQQQHAALARSYARSSTQLTSLSDSMASLEMQRDTAIQDAQRHALAWQIGIPAALVVGLVAGLLIGGAR